MPCFAQKYDFLFCKKTAEETARKADWLAGLKGFSSNICPSKVCRSIFQDFDLRRLSEYYGITVVARFFVFENADFSIYPHSLALVLLNWLKKGQRFSKNGDGKRIFRAWFKHIKKGYCPVFTLNFVGVDNRAVNRNELPNIKFYRVAFCDSCGFLPKNKLSK